GLDNEMVQFAKLLKEYRNWMNMFPAVTLLLPYSLYMMFGSVGIEFLNELIWSVFRRTFSFLNVLDTIAYFGFYVGFALTLISKEIKWAPYGLFASAFVLLFPFTSFSLFVVIKSAAFIYFGYRLLIFTAASASNHTGKEQQFI